MASILKQHPELAEEEEEISGEFFLDSQVVRTFRQGQGYYQLKMFGEARPYFHEVVEKEPEFLLGRLYLGLSDFQQENLEEARRQFQLVTQTSEIPRFNAFAHHMLGWIDVRQEEDELAIRQFTRALNLDEEKGDTWDIVLLLARSSATQSTSASFFDFMNVESDRYNILLFTYSRPV